MPASSTDRCGEGPLERCRHERFIANRLSASAIVRLPCLPLYLVLAGAVLLSLPNTRPRTASSRPSRAIVLSRSGAAHALSSASLASFRIRRDLRRHRRLPCGSSRCRSKPSSRARALAAAPIAGLAASSVVPQRRCCSSTWPIAIAMLVRVMPRMSRTPRTLALEHCPQRDEPARAHRACATPATGLAPPPGRGWHATVRKASAARDEAPRGRAAADAGRARASLARPLDRPAFLKAILSRRRLEPLARGDAIPPSRFGQSRRA